MLGEFLSANVSTPFLLFMVKGASELASYPFRYWICVSGFGEFEDESQAAYMTGVLGLSRLRLRPCISDQIPVSMFFLTQFFTSLLWVSHPSLALIS